MSNILDSMLDMKEDPPPMTTTLQQDSISSMSNRTVETRGMDRQIGSLIHQHGGSDRIISLFIVSLCRDLLQHQTINLHDSAEVYRISADTQLAFLAAFDIVEAITRGNAPATLLEAVLSDTREIPSGERIVFPIDALYAKSEQLADEVSVFIVKIIDAIRETNGEGLTFGELQKHFEVGYGDMDDFKQAWDTVQAVIHHDDYKIKFGADAAVTSTTSKPR